MRSLGGGEAADVLVGLDAPDDAAVYAWNDDHAIVSTVDFFTPIVDDPYTFGSITAANAMSDIYAMGGRPLFALNIVAFPKDLDRSILLDILRGGRDKAKEAGVAVIGGHSIEDKEPKYGMAVVGTVGVGDIYRKGDGRVGDRLILTKAIGTGIISTAIKQGVAPDDSLQSAVRSMLHLNRQALELARRHDVGAMTDVTGYGLLGHLAEVARASGLAAVVDAAAVPLLPGALSLVEKGCVPGGTQRNLEFVGPVTRWETSISEAHRLLLCDAQTSGGLLISLAADEAAKLVGELTAAGHSAADIGQLVAGGSGSLRIR